MSFFRGRDQVLDLLNRPRSVEEPSYLPHYDTVVEVANSGPLNIEPTEANLYEIRTRVHGLGLHGHLPPNTMAFVAPRQKRGVITSMFSTASANGVIDRSKYPFQPRTGALTTARPNQMSPDLLILRAGDVVMFDKPLEDGVAVWMVTPWVGVNGIANPGYIKSGGSGGSGGFVTGQDSVNENFSVAYVPAPAPMLRVYRQPVAVTSLSWLPVPYTFVITNGNMPTAVPDPTSNFPAYFVGGGVTHVTIAFVDNVATGAPTMVVAGESSDYEIWWMTTAGVWLHDGADDFDTAGRGTVSAVAGSEHTVEVYEVPHNAVALLIRRVGATLFHAIVSCTQTLSSR